MNSFDFSYGSILRGGGEALSQVFRSSLDSVSSVAVGVRDAATGALQSSGAALAFLQSKGHEALNQTVNLLQGTRVAVLESGKQVGRAALDAAVNVTALAGKSALNVAAVGVAYTINNTPHVKRLLHKKIVVPIPKIDRRSIESWKHNIKELLRQEEAVIERDNEQSPLINTASRFAVIQLASDFLNKLAEKIGGVVKKILKYVVTGASSILDKITRWTLRKIELYVDPVMEGLVETLLEKDRIKFVLATFTKIINKNIQELESCDDRGFPYIGLSPEEINRRFDKIFATLRSSPRVIQSVDGVAARTVMRASLFFGNAFMQGKRARALIEVLAEYITQILPDKEAFSDKDYRQRFSERVVFEGLEHLVEGVFGEEIEMPSEEDLKLMINEQGQKLIDHFRDYYMMQDPYERAPGDDTWTESMGLLGNYIMQSFYSDAVGSLRKGLDFSYAVDLWVERLRKDIIDAPHEFVVVENEEDLEVNENSGIEEVSGLGRFWQAVFPLQSPFENEEPIVSELANFWVEYLKENEYEKPNGSEIAQMISFAIDKRAAEQGSDSDMNPIILQLADALRARLGQIGDGAVHHRVKEFIEDLEDSIEDADIF